MKKYKIILCALMCMSCVACEDNKQTPEPPVTEEVEIMGYRPADVELSGDFEEIISLDRSYDDIYIFGKTAAGGYYGYVTDGSFSEYKKMNFAPKKDETVISSSILPFGKKAVLTYLDGKTMIYIYGKDGLQEEVLDCGKILDSPDTTAEIFPSGRNQYIISVDNKRLVQLENDGSYIWDIEVDGDILGVSRGADNKVVCLYDNGNAKFTALVDVKSAILTDMKKVDINEVYALCKGEKYNFICVSDDGIYGISGSTVEKITDFANMDFKPSDVRDIVETDNGYAVILNDGSMTFITEDDIKEIKSKKLIQIGVFRNVTGSIRELIKDYNESNSDGEYKVELKIYPADWTDNGEAFRAEILSGTAPDIISMDSVSVDSFGNYDYFADLYPFIDSDPELNREDFMPNILSGLERDGKLVRLGNQFRIETIMADKDSGIPENWTVDDLIKVYENLPEDREFFNFTVRDTCFIYMLDSSLYVDYGKRECYFDSPEFIKYLKFFQENEIGIPVDEFNERIDEFIEKGENGFGAVEQKETVIECPVHIDVVSTIYQRARSNCNVWAGFVGNGAKDCSSITVDNTYAINAYSPNIDGAWDFLRTMYTTSRNDNVRVYCMPVKTRDFEEQLKSYTRDNAYVDWETGKTVIEKHNDGQGNELENFTQEEYEYYRDKVMSLKVRNSDNAVDGIISEEAYKYFCGETTAEKTAETIQKRVSEYLKG